jgi:L-iditol 2-dehydrogenase
MGHVYPRAIELVINKLVDVDSMITKRFPLKEGPIAFKAHAENETGLIKSLIIP